ncbi:NosD domain-containing protein [Burkholderia vietnamiensis]|uniref:NosD domain-containing protein n=1 Tax=Burkholderia vietnamiensis TaxID=60552 RepID=UPI001ABAB8DB|nr:NosD domain-containing protein [Burkholderia vietnamiensis]
MKKFLIAALLAPLVALAQTYPSPTFNTVTLQNPLTVPSGGTGVTTSTGSGSVVLSSAPTIANPTFTGSITASGLVPLSSLATQAANTVVANTAGSSASPTAFTMPSCSGSSNALQYGSGSGFICGSNFALLSSPSFIGTPTAPTATAGTSTTQLATTQFVANSFAPLASPALTGTPTVPTAAVGTNTTQAASTAFVATHLGCKSILDYGGDNTGANTNDAALTNTINASLSNRNICVYMPPGTYKFAAQYAYSFPTTGAASFTLVGSGQDNTILTWAGGGGLKFNYYTATDNVTVSGLSITTGATNTGVGLFLNQNATALASAALTTIRDVTIRGADGYFATDYWANGIYIQGVSNVNLINSNIIGPGTPAGVGVTFTTNSSNIATIVMNITGCSIDQWNDGFIYGNQVQGVTISQTNFTNNNAGILVPSSQTNLNQLSVLNNQFNNIQYNIVGQSAIPDVIIQGNLFLIDNSASGVYLAATSHTIITGNAFQPNVGSPTSVTGIIVSGWVVGGTMISGNVFYNLTTGISLTSTSKNVNVQSNLYQGNLANTSNAGTGNVIGGGSA